MIYRIDIQHFITHAIDHFTSDDLVNCKYAILSAKIQNQGTRQNVSKIVDLYPLTDHIVAYNEYKDKELLEKMYLDYLNPKKRKKGDEFIENKVLDTFIHPLMNHEDVMIICDQLENDYVDIFCKYLKDKFAIEVIDLNELFIKGRTGPIYLDRDEVHDRSVEANRAALRQKAESYESSEDGRRELLKNMNKKEKIAKLKELGIKVTDSDKDHLDDILEEAWVAPDDDKDEKDHDYVEWH